MTDETVAESATILPFPTRRRRPYKSASFDRRNPPVNVRPIKRLVGDRPLPAATPLPPTGYVLLALIKALRSNPGEWDRGGGPDVLGELTGMLHQWGADSEVRRQVELAVNLVCAHRTGRWYAD